MDTREREREKRMRTTTTTEKQKYQRLQVARQVCRDIETIRHHFLSPDLMSSDPFPPISTYIIYIVRFVRFSFDDMFFSSKATHTTWNNSLINRNQTHYVPFSTIIRLQFIDSPFNQEAECNMHFASPHPLLKLVCRRETMHSPLSRSMALFIGVFTIYTALFSISFVRPVTVVLAPLVM